MGIQRRSEIIGYTHWTFDQLDEQPRDELDRLLLYNRLKAEAERERQELDNRGRR